MAFVRVKSKWHTIAMGVGTVVADYNGNVISETEPNEFGDAKLKFKLIGAWKLADKPNENGEKEWLKQEIWCSIEKNHALAPIVKNLAAGDSVFIFGKLRKASYRNFYTNRLHKNAFANLEYLTVISHGNGELAKEPKGEVADYATDDNDFDDF